MIESAESRKSRNQRKSALKTPRKDGEPCRVCGVKMGANGVKVASSHSVKQETLRIISQNGEVMNPLSYTEGVRNAGIFKMVCLECENRSFARYESRISDPNIKLDKRDLAEMALKVSLHSLSIANQVERLEGKDIGDVTPPLSDDMDDFLDYLRHTGEIVRSEEYEDMDDIRQYEESLDIALRSIGEGCNGHYLIMDDFFDYLMPVASCALVTAGRGIDGKIIQDITAKKGDIKEVFVFITPTKDNGTRVTVFCEMKFQGTFKHLKKLKIGKRRMLRYFFLEMIIGKDFGFYFSPIYRDNTPSEMKSMMLIGDFREILSSREGWVPKREKKLSEEGYLDFLKKGQMLIDKEFRLD